MQMQVTKTLTVVAILLQIVQHAHTDDRARDTGQCASNETRMEWNGSISFTDECDYLNRTYPLQILFPKSVSKTTTPVKLQFTFLNFTSQNDNRRGCNNTDRIEIPMIGVPVSICRQNNALDRYIKSYKFPTDIDILTIFYIHENSNESQAFAIEYSFPDYPCTDCRLRGQHCIEAPCIAEGSCHNLTTAYTCEEPNPCESQPCQNNGTCLSTHDSSQPYTCTCSHGRTGLRCNSTIPCSDRRCENGGTCVADQTNLDKCECPANSWGDKCEIVNDGTFCAPAETYLYHGSSIMWNAIKLNHVDSQPCPKAKGTASRQCLSEHNGPSWGLPDLTRCVSPEFSQLNTDVTTLLEAVNVTTGDILHITAGLKYAVTKTSGERLYAGDLAIATDTIENIPTLLKKVDSNKEGLVDIAEGCGKAISSIIDPMTSDVWSYTQTGYLENKVTTLLSSLEQISARIADRTSYLKTGIHTRSTNDDARTSESVEVSTDNIEFTIHVMDRASDFRTFNSLYNTRNGSSISLPTVIFEKSITRTSDPYIHIYTARFTSLAKLVADTNAKMMNIPTENLTNVINSDILSSKVLNVPDIVFETLEDSVKLTFVLQDTQLSSRLQQHCVFLNISATSSEKRWLKKGCYRRSSESNETHTVCYCNHLTNFAVLMDIYEAEESIDEFNSKILTYLTYGGGALSTLGCLISLIVFVFFRLKSERVRIHQQLALSIMLVQLLFLVGIDRTENKYVCMALAICLHYVLVAMFCWMLVEGVHLYLVLVKVFTSRSYMKKYIAIGWGIPLIIVAISAGIFHNDYWSGSICWLTTKVLLIAFVPVVALVIVINTIVLIVVMRIMLKSMAKGSKTTSEPRSSVKTGLKAASILLPLLGLTWTFGFLSITSKETLIFTYLFTLFNSLQGVFFFVFHCLLSVDVQKAYERRSRRKNQQRLTESSFSRRGAPKTASESDSSMFSSSFSRTSVMTAAIDGTLSLERKKSNKDSGYVSEFRIPSVESDDDVFYKPRQVIQSNVPSQISSTHYRNMNPNPKLHNHRHTEIGAYRGDRILNNEVRTRGHHGTQSTDEHVLYYGKNNKDQNDLDTYNPIGKNEYVNARK